MKNLIDELGEIKRSTPLIVCGAARSGTRMMTDLLNQHDNIAVQEEMHAKTLEKYFDFVKEVQGIFDHYSERKGRPIDQSWQASKDVLTHVFFCSANKKDAVGGGKRIKYHGIKTPGYERYFSEFEEVFSENPPFYIYCVRDAASVWRSWRSMGYLNDIETFTKRYERSLRQAISIKKRAPDRFIVFDLEKYVAAESKSEFVEDNVFSKLGLYTSEQCLESIENFPNRNSIKQRGKEYVRSKSLASEMKSLKENIKINSYKEQIFA